MFIRVGAVIRINKVIELFTAIISEQLKRCRQLYQEIDNKKKLREEELESLSTDPIGQRLVFSTQIFQAQDWLELLLKNV